MDKRKNKIILGVLLSIVVVVAAIEVVWNWNTVKDFIKIPTAHAMEQVNNPEIEVEKISDRLLPSDLWESDGYKEFAPWVKDLRKMRNEADGMSQNALDEWGEYLDEEEKTRIVAIENEIKVCESISKIKELNKEFDTIIEENKPAPEPEPTPEPVQNTAPTYNTPVSSTPASNAGSYTGDFKSAGVVYDGGYRYTWYSQNVLPGGGLNIPGRHVNANNFVCDENGYIVVAADPSTLARGSVIQTPFGTAKVYDTGCAPGTIDVYTNY